MPYIKREDRPKLDALLEPLIAELRSAPLDAQDGRVNYVMTQLVRKVYIPRSYASLNRSLGVLQAVSLELYRRVIAPYEDFKIQENGDLQ